MRIIVLIISYKFLLFYVVLFRIIIILEEKNTIRDIKQITILRTNLESNTFIHSSNPFQGEYTKKIKKSFIDWFALSVHVGKYPLSASST